MRRCCNFWRLSTVFLLPVFFILPVNLWYPQISSRLLFKPLSTEKYFLERLIVFCFSLPPLSPRCAAFPAEPEEKQKEILNNTIPEGKDSGDLLASHCCQRDGVRSAILLCHCWCSWSFMGWCYVCSHLSEVCWQLPWPVVWGDGASWQRGASQRGRVPVRMQGGAGLWRPGDFGLWHEGNS